MQSLEEHRRSYLMGLSSGFKLGLAISLFAFSIWKGFSS